MAKILSIEIGNSITRICEMDFKVKNPKIYKYFCIPTPSGVLEDGFIRDNAEFAHTVKTALGNNKIKTKQVVFTVTSSKIVTREVTLPALKTSQIGSYIRANANDYFPIDLSMYELAHVVLGVDSGDDGKEKCRVMVMAAGKDLIAGYNKFAASCGLRLTSLDYSGNSIYQIMKEECGDGTALVIKVEDNSTIASIISKRNLMLQRNLAYGVDKALNALMDSPDFYAMNTTEAFNTMCQKPCIKVVLNDRTRVMEQDEVFNESESESEARKKITVTFTQLINNLSRVIELYNSKGADRAITQIILVGIGAEIRGLEKLFTNELRIPTKALRTVTSVTTYQFGDAENIGRYVGVMGAAMDPVNFVSEEGRKKSGKKEPNYKLLSGITMGVFVVAAVVMVAMALIPYNKQVKKEEELKMLETQYAQAEVIYNQHKAMDAFQAEVITKVAFVEHPNDDMVDFLEELEEKLPADVVLTDLTSDGEKAVLTMEVIELEEAAKVFQILRGFESLADVNVGTTEEQKASAEEGQDEEDVEKRLRFSAECYYKLGLIEETTTAE